MNGANVFVDSNVLLYLLSDDESKAERAGALVDAAPFISVQILNEFVAISRRKFKLTWPEVHVALAPIKTFCKILELTRDMHERALDIAEETGIQIYDANIVSAAEFSGCDTLFTEDLNEGQRIGSVTIRNPFA